MPLTHDLQYFRLAEFKHPELVNEDAARQLDQLRRMYGSPLELTDDARLPGDLPPGASTTSLHFLGQAFDLRTRDKTPEQMWKLVLAAYRVQALMAPAQSGIELELVGSPTDHHLHIGFYLDSRPSRLLINVE